MKKQVLAQVVGLGPAGLGLAIAGDRLGVLPDLLQAGIAWIDPTPGGSIGSYGIISNSPWADYVDPIGGNGIFADLPGQFGQREGQVPLSLVGSLCGKLCRRLESVLPSTSAIRREAVAAIRMTADGGFVSLAADGRKLVTSRRVALACGGEERPMSGLAGKIILSTEIFRNTRAAPGRIINILGSSHGAAAVLSSLYVPDRQFTIWHRGPGFRFFYPDVVAARADGYKFKKRDICPLTKRVHRFGGVRKPYQDLIISALKGEVDNVQFRRLQSLSELVAQPGDVVQATGFQARRIPIFSQDGREIGPLMANGRLHVDAECRVSDFAGDLILGAYALGLGHQPPPSPSLGGEPSFAGGAVDGVNLYFGEVGEKVLDGLAR